MKLIENILNRISGNVPSNSDNRNRDIQNNGVNRDLRQREQELFGSDLLQQQKLYEKWIVKDSWLLRDEAIPLLCGTHPGSHPYTDMTKQIELWSHARKCVSQGLLPVIDSDINPEDWQVRPGEVYKWAAISRVEIPESLSNIMEFVMSAVKSTGNNYSDSNPVHARQSSAQNQDNDKERILGAALAILAAYPDKCRNNEGHVEANKIVEILEKKGEFWFSERMPALSNTARHDLINLWLKTVC